MRNFYTVFSIVVLGIFSSYAQELALVREEGGFGYINKSGEYVIEPKFKNAKSFSDGLAAAEQDDQWGFINASGEWAIEPQFEKVKYFNSGIAMANKDGEWQYITKSGTVLEVPNADKYFDFEYGVALFRQNDKVGLLGTDGKLVVEPTYESIKKFRNGHAKVQKGENWGMINSKGEVVIPAEYQEIGNTFSPAGVYAKKGAAFGIVHNGTFNPIEGADRVWNFHGDANLTYARKEKKVGFVNSKGEWVIAPSFDKARSFANGMAPVANGKLWGYVNEKGETVVDFKYKDAEVFADNGLAPVKEKRWGFIDKTGNLVIPMEYDITAGLAFLRGAEQKGFRNGLVRVKSKKGWGYLNEKGELLGNKWFENAEPFVVLK